jgi:hypothetical protein
MHYASACMSYVYSAGARQSWRVLMSSQRESPPRPERQEWREATEEERRAIRQRRTEGLSYRQLGKQFKRSTYFCACVCDPTRQKGYVAKLRMKEKTQS